MHSENKINFISSVLLLFIAPAVTAAMSDRIHDVYWFDKEEFYVLGGSFESGEIDTLGRIVPRYPRTIDIVDGDIYWANGRHSAIFDDMMPNGIWKGDPQNEDGVQIVATEGRVTKVQVDIENEMIYWIEWVPGDPPYPVIRRRELSGGSPETLISGSDINSFRLDDINDKLYWAERDLGIIRRANSDGSEVEEVVNDITQVFISLRDIEIDPERNVLYWMDTGETNETGRGIYRSGLDGSNVERFIDLDLLPRSLAVDSGTGKIYWARHDQHIYRADSNDGAIELFLTDLRVGNAGLQFDSSENRLYWIADAISSGRVQSISADGQDLQTLLYGFGTPMDLTIDPENKKLLWSTFSNFVMQSDNHGSGVKMVKEGRYQSAPFIHSIHYERRDGILYLLSKFAGFSRLKINEMGSSPESSSITSHAAKAITYDPFDQFLYWAGSKCGSYALLRSDEISLGDESTEVLISGDELNSAVNGVAIDLANGHLYWTEPENDRIRRSTLDGSQIEDFITGLEHPDGLSVNADEGKIYWNEPDAGKIRWANLDGSEVADLFTGLSSPGRPVLKLESPGLPAFVPPEDPVPQAFTLHQNFPNPFNPETIIRYELPVDSDVVLEVFDIIGRRVSVLVHETKSAGVHEAFWDATNAASGLYIYRISAGDFVQSRSMMLVK